MTRIDVSTIERRLANLGSARTTMIQYLKVKLAGEDWHGVQDAASDLRDIDAELVGLRWVRSNALEFVPTEQNGSR